jgi:hypothetical protein
MADPAQLSEALVREYLSKRGLRATLASFDRESPRNGDSVTSRTQVARGLRLDRVVRFFKERARQDANDNSGGGDSGGGDNNTSEMQHRAQPGTPTTILEMLATFMVTQRGPVSVSALRTVAGNAPEHGGSNGAGLAGGGAELAAPRASKHTAAELGAARSNRDTGIVGAHDRALIDSIPGTGASGALTAENGARPRVTSGWGEPGAGANTGRARRAVE